MQPIFEKPDLSSPPAQAKQRLSAFGKFFQGTGWLVATPFAWAGAARIRRSWSLIGEFLILLRGGPARDNRFKMTERSTFDLQATAFSYGMSVYQLEVRLAARRRQTARIAYASFALGWLFLSGWIWQALSSPWTLARVTSALAFLPFCALFLLVAFYNALLNFQIRAGRLASWYEYLTTADAFWPN